MKLWKIGGLYNCYEEFEDLNNFSESEEFWRLNLWSEFDWKKRVLRKGVFHWKNWIKNNTNNKEGINQNVTLVTEKTDL